MKKKFALLAFAGLLLQGCESYMIEPQVQQSVGALNFDATVLARIGANAFYVSTSGNDGADGSFERPWRTLVHAVNHTPANQGYAILLSGGTFVEDGRIEIPLGVSIYGAGMDLTILKAASSFHYYPSSPGYATDKFLISLNAPDNLADGNQTLSGFTIDGDSKKLHGGIYVHNRNNVIIDAVKVQHTNFTGMWLWGVKDSKLLNSQIINSSWGSTSYCVGALNVGNLERVEIANLNVNEDRGYGIKAIGPGGNNNIINLTIRDSRISVHPYGLWNNGSAPNIAIELWSVNLVNSEIYNTYVDNTISLINSNATPSTGVQTIRVHHNVLDMEARANGEGYGIELTVHDAEIDHNYFLKGSYGIANWDHSMKNWKIHHNTFYALEGKYPGEALRSQSKGLHNVKFYNNTVEFAGNRTMNVIGLYGGASDNIEVINNLFIENNAAYSYYPNKFIHMENGANVSSLTVQNNAFGELPVGNVPGNYGNNFTADPDITKSGKRPASHYMPKHGSPLINAGRYVGYPFTDSAPDIGAFEYGEVVDDPQEESPDKITLTLDSFTASLEGQMTERADGLAIGGTYFHVPSGSGVNYMIPAPASATFRVEPDKKDDYFIWVRVKSPSASNQTSYVYNGRGKWFEWSAGVHTSWTWVKITDGGAKALFQFNSGVNHFKIAWLQDNVQVDAVVVTNDPAFTP